MNIGDTLRTSAEREAAPIGAVIRHNVVGGNTWTKAAPNFWSCDGGLDHLDRLDGGRGWLDDTTTEGYVVEAWPSLVITMGMTVGDHLYTGAQRVAAPVGAVIRADNQSADMAWTKTGPDQWTREFDGSTRTSLYDSMMGGWYGDQPEGSHHYYEVLAWPVADDLGGAITDYAGLLASPVGSVFHRSDTPQVRWSIADSAVCMRVGDGLSVRVPLSVFEGLANEGLLRTGTPVGEPVRVEDRVLLPRVGETVETTEQMAALPLGTRVGASGHTWTKREGGWCMGEALTGGSPDHTMTVPGYNTVEFLPGQDGTVAPEVGTVLRSREQIDAMPVGTVIRNMGGSRLTRTRTDRGWERDGQAATLPLTLNYGWTVESLPVPVAEVQVPEVGTVLTTREQFAALPVGAVITNPQGDTWSKSTEVSFGDGVTRRTVDTINLDGWWTLTALVEATPTGETVFIIGMEIDTVEQYAALPVYSVVFREDGGNRPIVKAGDNMWQDHISGSWTDTTVVSGGPRTLVALPQGSVVNVPAPVGDSGLGTIPTLEHERLLHAARRMAVAGRDEEILSALRAAWDGESFTHSEIDDVLERLGLDQIAPEPETETITVTVQVEGRTTLSTTAVENLFEGSMSARLDEEPRVDWVLDEMEFSVDVDRGECGCHHVTEEMVEERLREGEVTFDSFTFEAECDNS